MPGDKPVIAASDEPENKRGDGQVIQPEFEQPGKGSQSAEPSPGKITLQPGDVTNVKGAFVITTINPGGSPEGGVDYAITEKFGTQFHDQLKSHLVNGELPEGLVLSTLPAGDEKGKAIEQNFKGIIFAVDDPFSKSNPEPLRDVIERALLKADAMGESKVYMPAIGAGMAAALGQRKTNPYDEWKEGIVSALAKSKNLKEVVIVPYTPNPEDPKVKTWTEKNQKDFDDIPERVLARKAGLAAEKAVTEAKARLAKSGLVETGLDGDRSGAATTFERTLPEAQKIKAERTDKVAIAGSPAEVDRDAKGGILRVRSNGVTSERVGPNSWISTVEGQLVQFKTEGQFVPDGKGLKFERKDGKAIPNAQEIMATAGQAKEISDAKMGGIEATSVKASVVGVSATGDVIHKVEEVKLSDGRTIVRQPVKGDKFSIQFPEGEQLAFMGNVALKDGPNGPELKVVTPFPKHDVKVTVQVLGADGRELVINREGIPTFPSQQFDLSAPSVESHARGPLERDLGLQLNNEQARERLQLVDSISTGPEVQMQYRIQLTEAETAALNAKISTNPELGWAAQGTVKPETIEEKIAKGLKFESKGAAMGAYEYDGARGDVTSTEMFVIEPDGKNGLKEPHVLLGRRGRAPYQGELAPVGGFFDRMPAKDGQPAMVESYKMARVREGEEEATGGKLDRSKSWLSSVSLVKGDPRNQGTGDHYSFTPVTIEVGTALRTGDDMGYVSKGDPVARPLSPEPKHFGIMPVSEINSNRRLLAFDYGRQVQEDAKLGLPKSELDRMRSVNEATGNRAFEIVGYTSSAEHNGERVPVIATKLDGDKPVFGSMEEAAKAYEEFAKEFGIDKAVLTEKAESGRWISAAMKAGEAEKNLGSVEAAKSKEKALVEQIAAEDAKAAERAEAEKAAAEKAMQEDLRKQQALKADEREAVSSYIQKALEEAKAKGLDAEVRAIERALAGKPLDGRLFNRNASQDAQLAATYKATTQLMQARSRGELEAAVKEMAAARQLNPEEIEKSIQAERKLTAADQAAIERLIRADAEYLQKNSLDERSIETGRALARALKGKTIDGWVFDRNLSENPLAAEAYDAATRLLSAKTQGELDAALKAVEEVKGSSPEELRADIENFKVEIDAKTREAIRDEVLRQAKKFAESGSPDYAAALEKIARGERLNRTERRDIADDLVNFKDALDPEKTKTLGDLTRLFGGEFIKNSMELVKHAPKQAAAEALAGNYPRLFGLDSSKRSPDGSLALKILPGAHLAEVDKAAIKIAKETGVTIQIDFWDERLVATPESIEGQLLAEFDEKQTSKRAERTQDPAVIAREEERARTLAATEADSAARVASEALQAQIADQTPLSEAATKSIRAQMLREAEQMRSMANRVGEPRASSSLLMGAAALEAIAEGRYQDAASGKLEHIDPAFIKENPELKAYAAMLAAKTPAELKALAEFADETGTAKSYVETALAAERAARESATMPEGVGVPGADAAKLAAEDALKTEAAKAAEGADAERALKELAAKATDKATAEQLERLANATPEERSRFVEMMNSGVAKGMGLAIVISAVLGVGAYAVSKRRSGQSVLPTFNTKGN